MDHTLIFLLIFSLALAVVSYYFGIHRPLPVGAWRSQSAFVVLTFMLIPILVYVLVDQSGAIGRLEGTGIRAHPGIKESVGIANGKGDNPTWVFEVQAGEGYDTHMY